MVIDPVPLLIVAMIIGLLSGIPVAYVLILVGVIGIYLEGGMVLLQGILIAAPLGTVTAFTFSTIPMFVLMAEFLRVSGLAEDVFEALNLWTSSIPGGLAISTTLANGMMAVLSGSSVANAAAMSKIAIPEMRKHGYKDQLSIGTVTGAGTFALLLPPSLALITFGILAGSSIQGLFIGGIIPGAITVVSYIVIIGLWYGVDPEVVGRKPQGVTWSNRVSILKRVWTAPLLAIAVLGGLYSGVFTASEAGAVGAIGALIIGIQHRMDRTEAYTALESTLETTTMVFMLIIGATLFSRFMALSGLTEALVEGIVALGFGRVAFLFTLMVLLMIIGTFMNQLAVLILAVPILLPVMAEFGISTIWFGVFMVKTIEMAMVTPPFGMILFVVTGSVDVDMADTIKGSARYLIADLFVTALLIFFPSLVTYLPNTIS